jgi:hypothetical protein
MIGRLAVAAGVGGVGLALGSLATQGPLCLFGFQALPQLVQQHEVGTDLDSDSDHSKG